MANRFLSNVKINDAYTFPASDGTNGQVITTDGAGNLSFQSAGEAGATVIYKDLFTGNASTVVFTLANSVDNEVKTQVYFDGVYQSKENYTLSGNAITFSTAPPSGAAIEVITFATVAAADYNQKLNFYGKAVGAITKGDAVMFAGAQGDHFLIAKATQAALEANHEYFLGLAAHDFANNQYGYVTQFGRLEAMDTSDYTAGDILWFDSEGTVAGAITTTEPAAPNTRIQIAAVVRVHQNEGVIFIRPTVHHELGETTDVSITNVADKDLLAWNAAGGVWENTKTLGDITTGNITTSGTVDGVDVSSFKEAYDSHNHDDRYYTELEVNGLLSNSANWDTAYNWGDHSLEGYLTSFTETDPIYVASSWYNTTNNSSNWDTAYGWGNHASAGYLTSISWDSVNDKPSTFPPSSHNHDDRYYTETEVSNFFSGASAITGYNKSNWDTAYGWGNHTGLYLPINGKATDSELLDGLNSTAFIRNSGYANQTEYSILDNGSINGPVIKIRYDGATENRWWDIGFKDGNGTYYEGLKGYNNSTLTWVGQTVIHSGNIGGQSVSYAANAGLLDNIDSSQFVRNDVSRAQVAGYMDTANITNGAFRVYDGSTFRGGFGTATWADGSSPVDVMSVYSIGDDIIFYTSGAKRANINSNGIYTYRFYDLNNTGYYIDPASTSRINTIYFDVLRNPSGNWILGQDSTTTFSIGSSGVSDTMLINATYITQTSRVTLTDSSYYIGTPTHGFRFNNNADTINALLVDNSGNSIAYSSHRAPIFYDSNNTGYYLNPAETSNVYSLDVTSSEVAIELTGTQSRISFKDQDNVWTGYVGFYGNTGILEFPGRNVLITAGYNGTIELNTGAPGFNSGRIHIPYGYLSIDNSAIYATELYDSNNSNYYLNPEGGSRIAQLEITGAQFFKSSNGAYQRADSRNSETSYARTHWYGVSDGGSTSNFRHAWYDGNEYFHVTAASSAVTFSRISGSTTLASTGDVRGTAYVDYDNTNYYLNPASGANDTSLQIAGFVSWPNHQWTWSRGAHQDPTNSIKIWDQYSSYGGSGYPTSYGTILHITGRSGHEDDQLYFSYDGQLLHRNAFYGSDSWSSWNSIATARHSFTNNVDLRAPIFYDSDNTGYYVNPNGTSSLSRINFNASGSKSIYGENVGNGYEAVKVAGNWDTFDIMGRVLDWTGSNLHFGDGYNGQSHASSYMNFATNGNIDYVRFGGDGYFEGDVIAYYSDARLKQNIKPIENALSIINSITGVTFEWNKKAEGVWKKKEGDEDFGLIAQEVEAVFPMGVAVQCGADRAKERGYADPESEHYDPLHKPTNEEEQYKTVRYDKMVAVAIQAIKELSDKIEELENKLNGIN